MKLYRVEVTKVIYMMAEDEDQAIEEGPDYASQEDSSPNVQVMPATEKLIQSDRWRGCLVYNTPGAVDMTAEEALVYGDEAAQDQLKLKKWNDSSR